ncbi:MAG: hypothetical protein ABEK16_00005 [Candidatus Nanohalobium sp.]
MGIFDSDDSEDEVTISPNSENQEESHLEDEVESKIVGGSGKESSESRSSGSSSDSSRGSRGRQMRERSNSKGKSTFGDDGVSLKDIHRQNERIIELLEELNGEGSNTEKGEQSEMSGDLNGVL